MTFREKEYSETKKKVKFFVLSDIKLEIHLTLFDAYRCI